MPQRALFDLLASPLDAVGLALFLLVFPIYHGIYPWLMGLFPDRATKTRIDLYRRTGRIFQQRYELFVELSWFFVMHGLGIEPQSYDPLVDVSDFAQVQRIMHELRRRTAAEVAAAPSHDSFFGSAPAPKAAAMR